MKINIADLRNVSENLIVKTEIHPTYKGFELQIFDSTYEIKIPVYCWPSDLLFLKSLHFFYSFPRIRAITLALLKNQ